MRSEAIERNQQRKKYSRMLGWLEQRRIAYVEANKMDKFERVLSKMKTLAKQ